MTEKHTSDLTTPAPGDRKLGFWALTAIVIGMVVGTGLYNIPQNMAAGAGPLGVAIAWLVTAVGMMFLVGTFKILADRRPELNAGIYQYTKEGFGRYAGFNIAWGYWLCTAFANIAYAVMLNDSVGAFIPAMLDYGWPSLLFGTVLIWGMFFIVARGIQTAKVINNLMAVLKVSSIVLVVVLLCLNVKYGTFSLNLLSRGLDGETLAGQVRSTMLVTLWCFIGIEGAVMMSARAKRPRDVGRASVAGFFLAWLLYVLVSMLCYGVMGRAELAGLENPSVAYVLRAVCGGWAYWFVIISVIVALLGGWLAWTMVCAQVPYQAAVVGIFPRSFMRLNRNGMPAFGLVVSSLAMQAFLIMVLTADDVYMAALNISSMMVLPAYLMSGVYLFKITTVPGPLRRGWKGNIAVARVIGALCTLYCLWLIYAGGLGLFAFTSLFYLAGTGFYLKSRRERPDASWRAATPSDVVCVLLIAAGLAVSCVMLAEGNTPF